MEKGREKERKREEGSYFTRGRVTCLFRVVEQIYIALSPPVIPLSRCCCRTLDSVRRREIKGEERGKEKGKRGEKRKWREEKREISRILKYRRPRRNAPPCRDEMSRERAFISPRSLVFAKDYPRCVARCEPFIFGSALRSNRKPRRVKPTCSRTELIFARLCRAIKKREV